MKIEKTFEVNAAQKVVWDFITSPERVAPCIPGCEEVEETEPGKYKAIIKSKIGPITTVFKIDIIMTEERPPEFAAYMTSGQENSRASRLKAVSTLRLTQIGTDKTAVAYVTDLSLIGRLGKFGSGLVQKVADSIGNAFVIAMRHEIDSTLTETDIKSPTAQTKYPC